MDPDGAEDVLEDHVHFVQVGVEPRELHGLKDVCHLLVGVQPVQFDVRRRRAVLEDLLVVFRENARGRHGQGTVLDAVFAHPLPQPVVLQLLVPDEPDVGRREDFFGVVALVQDEGEPRPEPLGPHFGGRRLPQEVRVPVAGHVDQAVGPVPRLHDAAQFGRLVVGRPDVRPGTEVRENSAAVFAVGVRGVPDVDPVDLLDLRRGQEILLRDPFAAEKFPQGPAVAVGDDRRAVRVVEHQSFPDQEFRGLLEVLHEKPHPLQFGVVFPGQLAVGDVRRDPFEGREALGGVRQPGFDVRVGGHDPLEAQLHVGHAGRDGPPDDEFHHRLERVGLFVDLVVVEQFEGLPELLDLLALFGDLLGLFEDRDVLGELGGHDRHGVLRHHGSLLERHHHAARRAVPDGRQEPVFHPGDDAGVLRIERRHPLLDVPQGDVRDVARVGVPPRPLAAEGEIPVFAHPLEGFLPVLLVEFDLGDGLLDESLAGFAGVRLIPGDEGFGGGVRRHRLEFGVHVHHPADCSER